MISKVKSVTANGTYDSNYGLLYKYIYEMEDGKALVANHKSQDPFNVGDEVEYEIKGTNDYGSWGSVKKPQEQGALSNFPARGKDPKTHDAILYQTCLKAIAETIGSPQSPETLASEAFKLAQFSKKYIEQL